ncbi:MAG: glycosyltransferase, partial [Bacilli bacterium]|nr:glycosyltransferase [Bacilli bacterium]
MDSVSEADAVYVLDTGSTDDTVKKLKNKNAHVVVKEILPWRFDVARNESLKLVPKDADICICMDLDEVIEPGWREKLEKIWNDNTTRLRYNYNWSFDSYGNPAVNFYIEKMHKRDGYKWVHPVHEILEYDGVENAITTDEITVNHYPDSTKSRGSYLPLLELSVKEAPLDDRNMHYLGREYMYYGKYNECIDTLIKHLKLQTATWKDERSASMRFIARCYLNLNRPKEAEMWFKEAIKEASYLRESYVELAQLYCDNKRYQEAYELLTQAFLIKEKPPIYINEAFAWNDYIHELMGIVCYNLKLYPESLKHMQ